MGNIACPHCGSYATGVMATDEQHIALFCRRCDRESVVHQPGTDIPQSLTEWQHDIGIWNEATFPHRQGYEGGQGPMAHLLLEVREAWEAFTYRGDLGPELADILVLTCAVAHYCGVNLECELTAKMDRNRKRNWQKPDANGVCLHVPEANAGGDD